MISYHSKKKMVDQWNNVKSKTRGIDIIGNNYSIKIEDVQYMKGMKYNLLSISQLCDNGFEVIFKSNMYEVKQLSSGKNYIL